jgi:heptosyltransferase-2
VARTWTETPKKLNRIRRIDAVGRTLFRPKQSRADLPAAANDPKRILVIELWHIGDVVLSTAMLRALRERFPKARITLLAKPHAVELLRGSGLADEIVTFDFPWTAFSGKYLPWRYRPFKFLNLFAKLRKSEFDLCIDCRMDLRSNLVAYLSGAKRRIGYDFGGGAFLLTDAVRAAPDEHHKVYDWLALLAPLGITDVEQHPYLAISEEEKVAMRERLKGQGLLGKPLVAIHPGARERVRRWDPANFAAIANHAVKVNGADVIVILDQENYGREIAASAPVQLFSGTLREMMALLACCDVLVCNDSGPMHIAAALGTRVIAIFGPQRKEWYGPFGSGHRVVEQSDIACRPCFDSCIFSEPICLTRLDSAGAIEALDEVLRPAVARN